jgi:hypothetical protein
MIDIDPENPRDVEEIQQDIDEIPEYHGYGFFGEGALFTELAAALAEQDRDEWGELAEMYPETTDRLES